MRILLAAIAFGACMAGHAWVARDHLNLNGEWEVARARAGDLRVPDTGWEKVEVPQAIPGWRFDASWWRRSFDAPAEWEGKRVKFVLQGARYCPVLYINGQKVGEYFGGYEPCEFDITDAVRPGQPNQVMVHVTDWTSLFRGDPVEFPEQIDWEALRDFPRDRVIYPIGGRYSEMGIWDDVLAYAVPQVYVQDVFVITDVSKRELTVHYELANESGKLAEVTLEASVVDESKEILSLPVQTVKLPAGKDAHKLSVKARWPGDAVTPWTPETPKLYVLETRLRGPAGIDRRRDRFGFRQFTIKGHEFYLNGVKRNILASSTWPLGARTHDEVADVLRKIKSANCVAFRTHTQPWRQIWYDVADEVGLMMIPEGAVWNDDFTYRLDDPDFWRNWANHLVGMVRALRNNPSVIMWSIENEFFGGRAKAGSVYEKRLADLGRLVKRTDPTRPIMYESDGDPDGAADVIGVHYPHEPPGHRLWPMEAYWMDEPRPIGNSRMFWPTPEFLWDKKKPLYIGEYLWWPSGVPDGYTLICGDEAYRGLDESRRIAKGTVWRWQTVAYRHYEVSGICPWTMFEGGPLDMSRNPMMEGQAYAMQPLAAYVREETRRAYSGTKVSRHLEIFNDTPAHVRGTLRWALVTDGKTLEQGGMGLDLEPGGHWDRQVEFVAPAVQGAVQAKFQVEIERDGQIVFRDERPFSVHSPARLTKPPAPVLLYDPRGETAKLLEAQGITVRRVTSLAEFSGEARSVLVIGEKALDSEELQDRWGIWKIAARLHDFVVSGGRIIVLQQEAYPPGLLPAQLNPKAQSTIAFVQMPNHELMAGLPEDAFKFWQPDHIVTAGELRREAVGFLPLVTTGYPDGISHCALMEAARGKGLYLLCQMPLVARFSVEPMAAEVFNRLLTRAAKYDGEASEVLLAGADEAYRQSLTDLGLNFREEKLDADTLQRAKVALVRNGARSDAATLVQWVKDGGRLVLDRPTPEMVATVGEAAGMRLGVDPYGGPPMRGEGHHPLIEAITRDDLYWVGERRPGPMWANRSVATGVADGALSLDLDFEPIRVFAAQEMEIEGQIVQRQADHIIMATTGAARVRFAAPADGTYLIRVQARGTKCEGVYAIAVVSVDRRPIGMVATGEQWEGRTLPTQLSAGEHEIEVRFINDRNAPPEDRNFYLREVAVGLAPPNMPQVVQIASGPCVAALPLGKGMVVVNFLRWDTEENNANKAQRFFAALLTGVGADFRDEFGVAYDITEFKPMEGLAHYSASAGIARLGSSGWIEGQIEVPTTGDYLLRIEAGGTKAAGEYPQVAVSVDGQEVATVNLTGEGWRYYSVRTRLEAGQHTLRLLFTNDYYKPPEDRNLMLRGLTLAPVR